MIKKIASNIRFDAEIKNLYIHKRKIKNHMKPVDYIWFKIKAVNHNPGLVEKSGTY